MSAKKSFFIFWLITGTFSLFAGGGFSSNGRILHTSQEKALEHKDFKLEVSLVGVTGEIDFVELRYRLDGEEGFRAKDMRPTGNTNRYQLTLPGSEISGTKLDYVVVAHLNNGSTFTYPEYNNPDLAAFDLPVSVPIVPQVTEPSPFIIVSPDVDEEIKEEEVIVSISLFNVQDVIDLKSIKLLIDGLDVTTNSQISSDLIVFAPPKVKKGLHRVEVNAKDKSGAAMIPLTWTFKTTGVEEAEKKFVFGGNGYGELRSESLGNRSINATTGLPSTNVIKNNYNRVGLTVNMQYADWLKVNGDVMVTSEEKTIEQPRNRYLLSVITKPLVIRAGDVIANFNDLVLWGKRVRGFSTQLNLGVIHFDFVTGETNRGIDPLYNQTAINDSLGRIIGPKTAADSSEVQLHYRQRNGTYRQTLIGFRPSFGGDNFRIGLNFLKVKDDVNSITYGANSQLAGNQPKDNIVLGSDVKLKLDGGRVEFNSGIALALVTNDITQVLPDSINGTPTAKIKDLDKYFIINLSTTPFPDITDANQSGIPLSKIIGALSKATSYNAAIRLNYFNNLFQFRFLKNGSVYTSLGQSFLIKDKKGLEISDRIRLMGSRVFLNVSYQNYSDNTDDAKEYTTKNNGFGFGFSYFPGADLPSANLSYRTVDQKNGAVPDSGRNSILNNNTNNITFSTNYNFKALGLNQSASINFVTSKRQDKANHLTLFEDTLTVTQKTGLSAARDIGNTTNVISLSITTQYERPMRTTFSYSYAKSEIGKGSYYGTYVYNSFGISADYLFLQNKLRAEGGVNITADGSASGKDPTGNVVTTVTKNSLRAIFAGARYMINEHHSIYLRTDFRNSKVSTDQIYMLRYEFRI